MAYAVFGEWVLYREVSEVRQLRTSRLWGRSHGAGRWQEVPLLLGLVRRMGGAARTQRRAYPAADRAYEIADRIGAAAAGGAQCATRYGHDEDPGFDDGVDLPGDGHPADEDLVLDDLQRGARL